jgi:putative nucleotidyltransferase with HDIG domain
VEAQGRDVIHAINSALLELQGALAARSLYPHRHPHICSSEDRARAMIDRILEHEPALTVFAVGDRVIHGREQLPSSSTLAKGLFRQLREKGADRVSLHRGLDAQEIQSFLDDLAYGPRGSALSGTTHIEFGFLRDGADAERIVEPAPVVELQTAGMASALENAWEGIAVGSSVDAGSLSDVVASVAKAVADSAGVMLPLASLKRHDEYTFVHTLNVAMLSTALAEAVGFQGSTVHDLTMAALLHDVGKKLTPLDLLNKHGRFTPEESAIMQRHPLDGARMLFSTPGVPPIAPIVAFEHHIRADLSGYPKVPRGWKLSLASRIVQVADVFDALRSNRPYRPALSVSEIFDIMSKDAGSFFDADLLDVFFRRVMDGGVPAGSATA